jgi:hypothetical protein
MKKLSLISLLLILFLVQCKKEYIQKEDEFQEEQEGVKIGEVKLSSGELTIIPYQPNDSIICKDSIGNIEIYYVSKRDIVKLRFYKDGGTDISTDYYEVEQLNVALNDTNNTISLSLLAQVPSYVSNTNINKNHFGINFYRPTPLQSSFFSNLIDTTDFYYNHQGMSIPYYNSYSIFSKTYNSVYEMIEYDYMLSPKLQRIFYNKVQGIVGYRTNSGVTWYLDN